MVLPIVGEGLVEGRVLFWFDVLGLSHPDWLVLVDSLELRGDGFDGLLLLLTFLGLLVLFLDLSLVLIFLLIFLFLLILIGVRVIDFLFLGLLDEKLNWERDELGVLFDEILESFLFKVFHDVGLEVADDLGTSGDLVGVVRVISDGEGSTGGGLPSVLFVVIEGSGDDRNLVGDEIGGVETNTELTDHGDIGTGLESLHESSGSRLGNGTKVGDKLFLGHTDTGISEGKSLVGFVWGDLDFEIRFLVKTGTFWVGDRLVSDLVQSIGSIGNELSQKDLFV